MYSILNDKQLVQAYPKFLAEWYTSQQLAQYALSLSENGMVVYPITSWTYVGLTEKSNYHVFTADLPADYGKFFYDMLFDVIDGIMYPVSRVLPVETELQGPAINRNGLWLNGGIAYSYVDFCEDAAQMQAIDDLLSTLNFSISIWVYTTYSGIDKPILHKSISDLTELMFALYPDKWVSTTKTTSFTRPTAGTWHLYTITVQNDNVSVYIDGSLVAQDNGHSYTLLDSVIKISMDSQYSANYFDGAVSEFTLWNQALIDTEVVSLYQNDLSGLQSKIAFAWPMYKIINTDDISTETTHTVPQRSSHFWRRSGYVVPSVGTAYGTVYVARVIDANLPKTEILWTHTGTKLVLYVPTQGEHPYQNIFWIPRTITDIHQYLFFTKLHSFTLWYKPLAYMDITFG